MCKNYHTSFTVLIISDNEDDDKDDVVMLGGWPSDLEKNSSLTFRHGPLFSWYRPTDKWCLLILSVRIKWAWCHVGQAVWCNTK